ncbi:MAG: FMN-binding protein, partial [Hyphomicrobiaceae bacterium]|nr:FMN-binding protein [Hyphomicrobiaceae bacterium]
GKGLWGTLYGFIALDADLNTVKGLTFYEHKETPGLGAEVDNRTWKDLWPERLVYGDNGLDGEVMLRVIKGAVARRDEQPHDVDGLSGATLTSRGVSNLLQYWLGDDGFKPYFKKFKEERSV